VARVEAGCPAPGPTPVQHVAMTGEDVIDMDKDTPKRIADA
jgi:hypothetical protein